MALTAPKTKRSIRQIPASHVMDMLKAYKERQAEYALIMGSAYNNKLGLVCPAVNSGIMPKTRLYDTVRIITSKRPELPPKLHPHSLRHTFTSLLLSQGVGIVEVANLLGDNIETVTKVYSHSIEALRAKAMNDLGDTFKRIMSQ